MTRISRIKGLLSRLGTVKSFTPDKNHIVGTNKDDILTQNDISAALSYALKKSPLQQVVELVIYADILNCEASKTKLTTTVAASFRQRGFGDISEGMAALSLYGLVTKNRCNKCNGNGSHKNGDWCEDCNGTGIAELSERQRSDISGISRYQLKAKSNLNQAIEDMNLHLTTVYLDVLRMVGKALKEG